MRVRIHKEKWPQRPQSAYIHFSNAHRKQVMSDNPGLKNTRLQKSGRVMENLPPAEKEELMKKAQVEKDKYKIAQEV